MGPLEKNTTIESGRRVGVGDSNQWPSLREVPLGPVVFGKFLSWTQTGDLWTLNLVSAPSCYHPGVACPSHMCFSHPRCVSSAYAAPLGIRGTVTTPPQLLSLTHCSPVEALQRDCESGVGHGTGDHLSSSSTTRVGFDYVYLAATIPSLILIYSLGGFCHCCCCFYFLNLQGAFWYIISFNPNIPASYISYIIQFLYTEGK